MGGGSGCKISMLWNWYTIDSCFIARSWHVKSKGGFAGSCIGVFFLVVAAQWLHRFCRELDKSFVRKHLANKLASENFSSEDELERSKIGESAFCFLRCFTPVGYGDITADFFEHAVRTFLYTVEWGLSYIIMLLFMYYNGYIIISCILGALVGKFIFSYKEPLTVDDAEDRKCCR
ncbi:Copper Transporter integral membrane protein that functions in high affinity copper transport [Scheffersomyces stipitis CBS 6054]|uniref:Copper transport protein n=1 Tax=Scheffersomyces stipitis (strain ATCC 58785 / CBS 6054 / NBRC 10063 / NRRL Y-11545) TaxID=322104 RepID=A3LZM5_PICST|nr:Copper Transporter integral membrane protein that functions in high affinity copper transport [Scheffersomyces stipitis CBS 6054]ABN68367.2 Copper Transporter integral membrane protein that functions in high affinity copper transport [Scheffersomyces stipitis CBS 6054]